MITNIKIEVLVLYREKNVHGHIQKKLYKRAIVGPKYVLFSSSFVKRKTLREINDVYGTVVFKNEEILQINFNGGTTRETVEYIPGGYIYFRDTYNQTDDELNETN